MTKYSLYKHVNVVSGNAHRELIYDGNAIIYDYMDAAWNDDQHDESKWIREPNFIGEMMGYKTYKYTGEL